VVALLAGSVAFSSPSALSKDLPRARPTLFPAVPRLYERLYAKIQETVRRQPTLRRRVFAAAEKAARERGRRLLSGEKVAPSWLFERLVYARIRRMTGFDRLDLAITGAAPMRPDLLEFFWGIGIPIVEGYGLTETAAPSTVNAPDAPRAGTVGSPLPGTEVALAEDGEVLLGGPHIFIGYDRMPTETREALAEIDGAMWMLTGDIGALDGQHLRIVDRKKEIEVLDTGKKVAPSPIEEKLKASPLVGEAVLVADGRKFVACLVQPDFEALLSFADEHGVAYDRARTREGLNATGERGTIEVDAALARDPRVIEAYGREVAKVNETIAEYERIKAFRLLSTALSADRGEITPTLKKRRKAILKERATDVDAMFA
jgi:long-chain acyl-CoA synthetase